MDDRLRDRGTIKWTSLMLPEHVEMVKNVWEEDERIEKPILDDQQLEEIGFALERSMQDGLTVKVKYHNGFDFSYVNIKVTALDSNQKVIRGINQKTKDVERVLFEQIIEVSIL